MATLRFKALGEVLSRQPIPVEFPSPKSSDYFGINVFDKPKMQKYLSKEVFESVMQSIDHGVSIDRRVADQVAAGMKTWAIERGITHYTHWFQPLTDAPAEKHDTFLEIDKTGKTFESFDGAMLVQQEPDASSFPSGGLRQTFEARGYTAWDPSSPAFIVGKTLCIPTIFISYTGETLDYKTPLLKSIQALDKAAVEVCQMFDRDVTKVYPTLGWEQEYFLIDEALYMARPDLVQTERTLMGHSAAKDQQLADHYFGAIPDRVLSFMYELEIEAHKLGIPVKTRHNEVAPNQYECSPIFEECNLAVDHNLMLMDLMRKIARHHNFRVLLHEKPFEGINGSGKHNNWSMATNTGTNLLKPGNTPRKNLQFLTFIVNVVKAVFVHNDLLRASIVSSSNQHRLGSHEAPPAIISAFLGTRITEMLNEIEEKVSESKMTPEEKTALKLDIGKIPEILLDNTDRNRTSPFAFIGNRFEFRAVGSSANCASAMIAINAAVAEQLIQFAADVEKLKKKGVKKDEAILQVLRRYIIESKAVRFEGDGYSDEWVKEALKRGLTNVTEPHQALKAFISDDAKKTFVGLGIYNDKELHARYEVKIEKYAKDIQIESRVLADLALNHIVPVAIQYQNVLLENVEGIKDVMPDKEFQELAGDRLDTIRTISRHITAIKTKSEEMVEERKKANALENLEARVDSYATKVRPYLEEIRYHIDRLERIVDNDMWPLPKYRELLFIR